MRSVILGTAGHIDHGKTALVRALTGVDTDRLEEERRRGISIELGFAQLVAAGVRFGIVDVPGHERFVKNMLAGAAGIDLVMLVVAADEGVMPQTREHLDIIDFLGVDRGVVALTKCDLADEDSREISRLDAEELLEGTSLEGAPVQEVSSITGDGLDALKKTLGQLATGVPERSSCGAFRLPVDRVFTMEGYGTVVTGTAWSGSVEVGDRLEILPSGREVRVRRVQVHGKDAECAEAGRRTALALHGVSREEVRRGEQVVTPGSLQSAPMLDVRVRVAPGWSRPIRNRERVRFHLGASEDLARIVLLDRDELLPGEDCLAQLRMETPAVSAVGDRFVLRSYSPMRAMAGGVVIDPRPKKHRRFREDELQSVAHREGGGPVALVTDAVEAGALRGMRTKDLADATGLSRDEVATLVEQEVTEGRLRIGANRRVVSEGVWEASRRAVVAQATRFLEEHTLRWGIPREEVRTALGRETAPGLLAELLTELEAEGAVELRGELIRTGGGDVVFEGQAARERDRQETLFRQSGCSPPSVAAALAGGADARLAEEVLAALLDRGDLVKLAPDLLVHRDAYADAKDTLGTIAARDGGITVGAFRDALGISRKHAVPLLEHFDEVRVTRRSGDERALLTPRAPAG
ncbi:MAG: selenocysteine-specific translation elongation factor [Gemmatimonadota bacterium]|nr:selenocysteine-specific translation elongation factor [Gemmatimonadota bacterium]MDP6802933.1 selenocysteine-specific translation elongation factor [Gemmatimonadota bacterium]MDP7032752.1 selenocysteine-specific translation elongation factor [Gemmatimonadota bacterium]